MKILISYPRGNDVFNTFFTKRALDRLAKSGELVFNDLGRSFTEDEFRDALEGIDIVITGWGAPKFDEKLLSKADKLKMVAHAGGSVALLLSEDCALEKKNIPVFSGNKYFALSVAEGAILYMLCGGRQFVRISNEMMKEGWWKEYRFSLGLRGKSVGLIGFGEIAKDVLPLLKAFAVDKIKVYSSYLTKEEADKYGVEVASLEEIFKTCEFVSVHSGLNAQNYHLIKEEHMRSMMENAVLINTARGPVIDEDAMAVVFKDRPDLRAVIDVYSVEPLPMDSPLRQLPNMTLLPHQGGPTTDYRELVTLGLAGDIEKMIKGETDFENLIPFSHGKRMTDESLKNKK